MGILVWQPHYLIMTIDSRKTMHQLGNLMPQKTAKNQLIYRKAE